ncbi:hypothetical protein ICN42_04010 [Polynucleobacter sp. 71A-WALBACH]|uniref:hypothetical protein n=1 Tax=Polynucleobacter sp. 71A-WALBACH TaxID=2689097 RepID=UPI001C0C1633|nr:hypothetical protein [Polynucleobacter sp. 71A-WALBACH]MBU3593258.1 hypothetical protein [Polynucleobacter sp. 71A-WALBACH]
MANKKIIFKVEYGGLGDHLFYSALPRLLKEQKLADEVYISDKSNFRNPAIFDLIWKHNPHLNGIGPDAPTSLTEIHDSKEQKIVNIIFERFGLHSEKEFPVEVYQELEMPNTLGGKYIDLNYVSFIGAFSFLDKIKVYRQHPDHIMINPDKLTSFLFAKCKKIVTKSLLEYAGLIASSSSFITLASGGATLAAALKKPSVVYYGYGQSTIFHHGMHRYIQVGGASLFRRRLARLYNKRNARRLKRAKNK